jgi:hypothetical protein
MKLFVFIYLVSVVTDSIEYKKLNDRSETALVAHFFLQTDLNSSEISMICLFFSL